MNDKKLQSIVAQIDALKYKTYEILKALNHLGKEISTEQVRIAENTTKTIIDMPKGGKLNIYVRDGMIVNSEFIPS